MKTSSHETESLVQVFFAVVATIRAAELDTLSKEPSDVERTGHDVRVLIGNVVFHSGFLVDGQFNALVDGASQAFVVLGSILVVGVVFGVVDVVYVASPGWLAKSASYSHTHNAGRCTFWSVTAQTIRGHFELARSVAECKEAQNAQKQTDSLCRDGLDGSDIDGLGVVAQPIAKVDSGNHELVEFLAASRSGQCDLEKRICDVTVAPCDTRHQSDNETPTGETGRIDLQFWPETLEMLAMLPAPKAWVGLAKRTRRIIPHRRGVILKDMAGLLWQWRAKLFSPWSLAWKTKIARRKGGRGNELADRLRLSRHW